MKELTRKGLSKAEAKVVSDLVAEGKAVFSIRELVAKAGSVLKARKMASALVRKGWLARLSRGVYLVMELAAGSKPAWTEDSYYIASKLAKPYYIGFFAALNYHGWTEQVPVTLTIATTKTLARKTVLGTEYEFVRLSPGKFFGYSAKSVRGHIVNVSDPEKTLVDALDHPEYCGGPSEVAKALYNASKTVDWKKVVKYAKRMRNGAIFKRLGYLCELMGIALPDGIRAAVKAGLTAGYAPLFPSAKPVGKHDSKWRVIVNAKLSPERVLG